MDGYSPYGVGDFSNANRRSFSSNDQNSHRVSREDQLNSSIPRRDGSRSRPSSASSNHGGYRNGNASNDWKYSQAPTTAFVNTNPGYLPPYDPSSNLFPMGPTIPVSNFPDYQSQSDRSKNTTHQRYYDDYGQRGVVSNRFESNSSSARGGSFNESRDNRHHGHRGHRGGSRLHPGGFNEQFGRGDRHNGSDYHSTTRQPRGSRARSSHHPERSHGTTSSNVREEKPHDPIGPEGPEKRRSKKESKPKCDQKSGSTDKIPSPVPSNGIPIEYEVSTNTKGNQEVGSKMENTSLGKESRNENDKSDLQNQEEASHEHASTDSKSPNLKQDLPIPDINSDIQRKGFIKTYNPDHKPYGFIQMDNYPDLGEEIFRRPIFFHRKQIHYKEGDVRELHEREIVKFNLRNCIKRSRFDDTDVESIEAFDVIRYSGRGHSSVKRTGSNHGNTNPTSQSEKGQSRKRKATSSPEEVELEPADIIELKAKEGLAIVVVNTSDKIQPNLQSEPNIIVKDEAKVGKLEQIDSKTGEGAKAEQLDKTAEDFPAALQLNGGENVSPQLVDGNTREGKPLAEVNEVKAKGNKKNAFKKKTQKQRKQEQKEEEEAAKNKPKEEVKQQVLSKLQFTPPQKIYTTMIGGKPFESIMKLVPIDQINRTKSIPPPTHNDDDVRDAKNSKVAGIGSKVDAVKVVAVENEQGENKVNNEKQVDTSEVDVEAKKDSINKEGDDLKESLLRRLTSADKETPNDLEKKDNNKEGNTDGAVNNETVTESKNPDESKEPSVITEKTETNTESTLNPEEKDAKEPKFDAEKTGEEIIVIQNENTESSVEMKTTESNKDNNLTPGEKDSKEPGLDAEKTGEENMEIIQNENTQSSAETENAGKESTLNPEEKDTKESVFEIEKTGEENMVIQNKSTESSVEIEKTETNKESTLNSEEKDTGGESFKTEKKVDNIMVTNDENEGKTGEIDGTNEEKKEHIVDPGNKGEKENDVKLELSNNNTDGFEKDAQNINNKEKQDDTIDVEVKKEHVGESKDGESECTMSVEKTGESGQDTVSIVKEKTSEIKVEDEQKTKESQIEADNLVQQRTVTPIAVQASSDKLETENIVEQPKTVEVSPISSDKLETENIIDEPTKVEGAVDSSEELHKENIINKPETVKVPTTSSGELENEKINEESKKVKEVVDSPVELRSESIGKEPEMVEQVAAVSAFELASAIAEKEPVESKNVIESRPAIELTKEETH